jgi:hypothetical protein
MFRLGNQVRRGGAIGAGLGVAALIFTACGPSRQAQCLLVLDTVQAADNQRVLGDPSRAAILENAQVYETLAQDLAALDLKDQTLQGYRDEMVTGYQAVAAAMADRAAAVEEDGTYSYIVGDTEAEATYNRLQANEQRGHNTVITAMERYQGYCTN